jgi:hypothetical protein
MMVLRPTWPVGLSRMDWPLMAKRIWEPLLPVPGGVKVERGCDASAVIESVPLSFSISKLGQQGRFRHQGID